MSRVHQNWTATENKGNEAKIQTIRVHQKWAAIEDEENVDNSNKEDLWHDDNDKQMREQRK